MERKFIASRVAGEWHILTNNGNLVAVIDPHHTMPAPGEMAEVIAIALNNQLARRTPSALNALFD